MDEKNKFPESFIDAQFLPYLEKSEIQSLVNSLAFSVSAKYRKQELMILGILKGGIITVADFVRKLKGVLVTIDFIKVSNIGREDNCSGTIQIEKDIEVDIFNKKILIVEDIVDSGRGLKFIKERLELSSPASIEILTLFDRPSRRKVEIKPDYIGKTIEERFVIGNGLDLEGFGRNLEKVYSLKYPN